MKIDQLAFYAHTKKQEDVIKEHFGLQDAEWIQDEATGVVNLYSDKVLTSSGSLEGKLQFNYDLGIELEILTYQPNQPNWHNGSLRMVSGVSFLSHVGIHMEGSPSDYEVNSDTVQTLSTHRHTNPYLIEKGRTYFYAIEKPKFLDCSLKYIWRIEDEDR